LQNDLSLCFRVKFTQYLYILSTISSNVNEKCNVGIAGVLVFEKIILYMNKCIPFDAIYSLSFHQIVEVGHMLRMLH
jgi:hypothetical protein